MPKKMTQNQIVVALGFLVRNRKNFRVLFRKQNDGSLRYMLVSRISSISFQKGYVTVYSEDKGDLRRFKIDSVINIETNLEKPQMTQKEIEEYQNC